MTPVCKRCGLCCTQIVAGFDAELAKLLVPAGFIGGVQTFRCILFKRGDDGTGFCIAYDGRPNVCRMSWCGKCYGA